MAQNFLVDGGSCLFQRPHMKLSDYLSSSDLSERDFAARLGVTAKAVSHWVGGFRTPRPEQMQKIRDATGGVVTPNDFLEPGATKEIAAMSHSVTEAIEAIARGEIVIVTDDGDRENEGDLICAASLCTPEKMAFIIRNCCGIVCAPVTAADARRLNLQPMVAATDAPHATAFTVSVDVKHGLTTGISAEQRSNTVRGLANGKMGSADFVRPGHVFPLIAREGGVLMRSGHTEAAVDLCRLAGLPPVGVICELANDDGTVMAGPQIEGFSAKHDLKRISVADLIAHRQAREKIVERVNTFQVMGTSGPLTGYAYVTPYDPVRHFAFVQGDIGDGRDIPTRLHRIDIIADVIAGGASIRKTFAEFKKNGRGVFIFLRDGTAGVPVNIAGMERPDSETKRIKEWREIGLGAQILRDLGISSIRLRTPRPMTYVGLSGFGIEISSSEGLE